jgi:cell division protein FtsL
MKLFIEKYHPRRPLAPKIRKKKLSSGSFIFVLVIAALVVFACTQIWQRVYILNLASEVGDLKRQKNELKDLAKKNQVEINELCRHSRIRELALEKFDLRQTSSDSLFTLVSEQKIDESIGFDDLFNSLKKVADHLPVVTESKAETKEIYEFDKN